MAVQSCTPRPIGRASVLKVITNQLAGCTLVSTGEAFAVARKPGIDLGVAHRAIRVSSINSFVHETEGQLILNGRDNINFTIDHELKDMTLLDALGGHHTVPVEPSPVAVAAVADGLERHGPWAWSSSVVKRLEDDCDTDLRAPGFPDELIDHEPRAPGVEVIGHGERRG